MSVVAAAEWRERARALRDEGWRVVDLCGLDALGLTRNFPGAGARGPEESSDAAADDETDARETAAAPDSGAQPSAQHPSAAVELPYGSEARFHVVVQLLRHETKERATVHVVAGGDPPTVPSVTELWPTVNFMEREAYDMFGIHFDGHPDLKRILMPDEWEGHPLRKDYGVGKVPVEFVPQPLLQIETPGQGTDASGAMVAVDSLGQMKPAAEDNES